MKETIYSLIKKDLQIILLMKTIAEHVHFDAIYEKGYEVLHRAFYKEKNILELHSPVP